MLCLTRRVGEEIYIGKDIIICVDELNGRGAVKIRITAPQNFTILRGELVEEETKRRIWEEVHDKKGKYHNRKFAELEEINQARRLVNHAIVTHLNRLDNEGSPDNS